MIGIASSVVAVLTMAVGGLVPGAGTYFLVPWGWLADHGEGDPSERTLRATRAGLSVSFAGGGVFTVAGFVAVLGLTHQLVAVGGMVLGALAGAGGLLVASVFVLRDAL